MKVLLTGATGMLGSALQPAITKFWPNASVIRFSRADLSIAYPSRLIVSVNEANPSLIINAAAHTDVEGAESDPDAAFAANAELPGVLASACRGLSIPILHVSSTGCYGSWKDTAYNDYDEVRPTTIHHMSKIAGEQAIRSSGAEHLIVRTGWLFGGEATQPKNFVFKRVLEALKNPVIHSDATQRGNPTWVDALAPLMLQVFASGVRGTCNLVSKGSATRLDYVREIVRLSGVVCEVKAADGAFVRKARVAPNEAAENIRLGLFGLDNIESWDEQLGKYMKALRQTAVWRKLVFSSNL